MKTNLMLLFGGQSSEHEVSIASAANVYEALNKDSYEINLIYISKDGKWSHVDSIENRHQKNQFSVELGSQSIVLSGEKKIIDVIFPVLHGAHGEDGDVQGLARLLGVPVVGPSLVGAAVAMDKDITKRLVSAAGVQVSKGIVWHTSTTPPVYEDVRVELGNTLFVKPVNAGSSVGVSRAIDESSFKDALEVAAMHDTVVLIEEAIVGREVELAVLGNDMPEVSDPGEIIPGEEFYSYEDKYAESSKAKVVIPADLSVEITKQLKNATLKAYTATRGRGMARVDFFVTADGRIILNEINSIPGFTNISMYPKLWVATGITYSELLDKLIGFALKK